MLEAAVYSCEIAGKVAVVKEGGVDACSLRRKWKRKSCKHCFPLNSSTNFFAFKGFSDLCPNLSQIRPQFQLSQGKFTL
jgi:hypothetical protein